MSEVLVIDEYTLASEQAMAEQPPVELSAIGPTLLAEFTQAELDRRDIEERWLKDLRQYKGKYDPEVEDAIGVERSKAFVRKTRVKVKTVDSRVADLLFPAGAEKNWEVTNTPVPSVAESQREQVIEGLQAMLSNLHMQQQAQAAQQGLDPRQVPAPALTRQQIDQAVLNIAKESAKKMSKVIEDQLVEARYKEVSIKAIHSSHLYGTGIIKGPLVERKIRTSFVREGGQWVQRSEQYVVPFVDFVPLWRFYPDMSSTELQACQYVWERHLMTAAEMSDLAERRSFDGPAIVEYIKRHPNGMVNHRTIDGELKIIGERSVKQGSHGCNYEVLERWGWLRGSDLKSIGCVVPEERCHESFFSNVWMLPDGQIIKAVLQPINGVTWPYHLYYFDKDETSIFGEGLATIMRDDQEMINAAVRMMLDNAGITAGPMVEVSPGLLSRMDNVTEMGPWKVWLRNNSNPGQAAVRPIVLPSNLAELGNMAKMFEANADEVTAIPRYMYGENVSGGAAGTASGMSMLMGAVNIVIKDLITAWDEGITRSFLQAMYRWNMQFNPDNEIKGDFDVKARGTSSLVAKEVRAQQLEQFAAQTANPLDGPLIKREKLLRYRAEVNELADVVKTEDEVKAEQQNGMAQQQAAMAQMQMQMMQAQLAELQSKVARQNAEAESILVKNQLLAAQTELTNAKVLESKVEAIYAALQAAGVAATNPAIAPAGDEVLRSSGWKDATPDPTIAQLMGPSVQGGAPLMQAASEAPQQPQAAPQMTGTMNPGGPERGVRQGIETARIE